MTTWGNIITVIIALVAIRHTLHDILRWHRHRRNIARITGDPIKWRMH